MTKKFLEIVAKLHSSFATTSLALGFLFLFFCFWFGYQRWREPSFEDLMGKKSKYWKYMQSEKDFEDLHFYKNLYEKNKKYLNKPSGGISKIPKRIHFIWLGPKPFPETSKKNVQTWKTLHPDWKMIFWTDSQERPCPIEGMEKQLLQHFSFKYLPGLIEKTDNYGEKSDIWRYEILLQEGGIYVDHDVKCYQSFDALLSCDFFAALEKPHTDLGFTSAIVPAICVIGARPEHPILEKTALLLQKRWEDVGREYLLNDVKRVVNRTFKSFGDAVRLEIDRKENLDLILPASYFFAWEFAPKEDLSRFKRHQKIFARHFWEIQWQNPEKDELRLENQVEKLRKKNRHLLKKIDELHRVFYLLFAGSLLLWAGLYFLRGRRA